MTRSDLDARLDRLHGLLRSMERVVVAFSGGVDSAFLLKAAVDALGPAARALIAVSPSLAPWELEEARAFAAELGAALHEVATHEMDRAGYRANAGDRCYHCKAELFDVATVEAAALGHGVLVYGAIPDDLGDHRPGMRAADERAVRAPLIEAGLSKADIRELSRRMGLPTWDKPAGACLSSRFPYGTAIDPERLSQVARCEQALRALGLRQFRARFHDQVVRVEIAAEELPQVFADAALRAAIVQAGKAAGFRFVTLDLEGYRTGSANPILVQVGAGR
ncbi:MAG: ATP-dependent sacrificial sulfur transferase LarE [Myxococcales bacterium]|nr:ATP-dependent sacrificial sulfur transferase LarE [Myxococcales bacterium]